MLLQEKIHVAKKKKLGVGGRGQVILQPPSTDRKSNYKTMKKPRITKICCILISSVTFTNTVMLKNILQFSGMQKVPS